MELYLIRHAHAVDGLGLRDDDRPLSAHGRRQALDVGGALAKEGVRLHRILTSPLVRAVETASLIAAAGGFAGGLEVSDSLRPDGSFKGLARELALLADTPALALVGHEPSIGHALSKLLQHKGLSMTKGGVVRLRFASVDEPAKLVWTLSPAQLAPVPTL